MEVKLKRAQGRPGAIDKEEIIALKAEYLQYFAINRCNISDSCDKISVHRRTVDRWRAGDADFNAACEDIEAKVRDMMEKKLVDLTDCCEADDAKMKSVGLRALDRWLCARHPEYRLGKMASFGEGVNIGKAIIIVNEQERKALSDIAREACKKRLLGSAKVEKQLG